MSGRAVLCVLLVAAVTHTAAAQSTPTQTPLWERKPVDTWSITEVQDFMLHSPWVVRVSGAQTGIGSASIAPRELPPDHPFYDPVTADIVAFHPRAGAAPAPAPYFVRWYSARLMREVLVRGAQLARPGSKGLDAVQRRKLLEDDDLVYVVTVSGPGLHALDELGWSTFEKNIWLYSDTGERFEILDVRTPRDLGGSGEVMFFFDRAGRTVAADATRVTFHAEIGTAVLDATFHPREMAVAGRRDLAGRPPSEPDEVLRRRLALALSEGAEPAFKRALTATEVRPVEESDALDFIVVYDARRETPHETQTSSPTFDQRMIEAARRVGASWGKDEPALRTFWFVDIASGHQAYLQGPDCVTLATLDGAEADELFQSAVKRPK